MGKAIMYLHWFKKSEIKNSRSHKTMEKKNAQINFHFSFMSSFSISFNNWLQFSIHTNRYDYFIYGIQYKSKWMRRENNGKNSKNITKTK